MPVAKIIGAQRDFSAGELDVSMKRADENPLMKIGARQASNWRILNSKTVQNRSGRSALFLDPAPRVEEVMMSPGQKFFLAFGVGYIRVFNAAGAQVFTTTKKGDGLTLIPWTLTTIPNIVWVLQSGTTYSIFITYADGAPANVPQVLTWDGVSQTSTWVLTTFAEEVTPAGQKRTIFTRISPQNVTMLPSGVTGSITLVFSAPILNPGMVNTTRFLYCGRQLLLTGYTDSRHGTASVIEQLPPGMTMALSAASGSFSVGDEVRGGTSGAEGIIIDASNQQTVQFSSANNPPFGVGGSVTGSPSGAAGTVIAESFGPTLWNVTIQISGVTLFAIGDTITDGTNSYTLTGASTGTFTVQLLPNSGNVIAVFVASETIAGPNGSATVGSPSTVSPQAVATWDDEVMNAYRGYPSSTFFDQNRLGFCNFPSLPSGIAWSAIGLTTDFYVNPFSTTETPSNAIFELAPAKSQVYFVVPGPESGEFIFCDSKLYYIPITSSIPLEPGSIAFNILSSDGSANVQPRPVDEVIFYVAAGGLRVRAVIAPGAYYRPFNTLDVCENHTHLFTNIIALATPTADGQFPERYVYAMNSGGSLAVGRYKINDGRFDNQVNPVGWLPWSGGGTLEWIAALSGDVIMTTSYAPNGIPPANIIERLDDTQYLDAAIFVNNPPTALAPTGGQGKIWWLANGTVFLIDLGTRFMGIYNLDNNGNIIPQNIDGENLSSSQLVAGQPWTATIEPFVPDAPPGQSQHQRMFKRRVARMAVYVSNSTGFLMARLFAGPLTPASPALGTIMNTRRVTAYNQGDDPTKAAPLREEAQRWRPLGRAYDPRVAVIKDTPGPLLIHEFGIEATI